MQPFDSYPGQGRQLLGRLGGANARRDYGYRLYLGAGIARCAYCGVSFVEDYYRWVLLSVDHVVPRRAAMRLGIPAAFYEDAINLVLACSCCNGFDNRFDPPLEPRDLWTLQEFVALRDAVFTTRSERIALLRQADIEFFEQHWKIRR